MKMESEIDGYKFPFLIMDNRTFAYQNGYKGFALFKYWLKIYLNYFKANQKLKKTLRIGKCYYGPFKGEFGHFTAHNLPFLTYLHKRGVKIIYCGMELHSPLLVDEKGDSILYEYRKLRDFFAEVSPRTNATVPPKDIQIEIDAFTDEAQKSGIPFWNINDNYYYWFIHRNWLLKGHTDTYSLDKYYRSEKENSCVIFPRSKGPTNEKTLHNNGKDWDYQAVIDTVKPFFDKVYICGHPSQVLAIKEQDKVELRVTADNAKILEACSNSNLIITQHSGVNNLGEYTNTKVLIIHNGGKEVADIGSMNDTLRFRKGLNQQYPLSFAFSLEEIKSYVEKHVATVLKNAE